MYYLFDQQTGSLIGVSITQTDNSTSVAPDSSLINPKWDGTKWINGEAMQTGPIEPTDLDRLRQTIADLTQQLILNGVI